MHKERFAAPELMGMSCQCYSRADAAGENTDIGLVYTVCVKNKTIHFITARRYASAVYAVTVCLSVCYKSVVCLNS